jgi:hypothetical protein
MFNRFKQLLPLSALVINALITLGLCFVIAAGMFLAFSAHSTVDDHPCDIAWQLANDESFETYKADREKYTDGLSPYQSVTIINLLWGEHKARLDANERTRNECKYGDPDYGGPIVQ